MSRADYEKALRRQFDLGAVVEAARVELREAERQANLRAYYADVFPTPERVAAALAARERHQAAVTAVEEASRAHDEAKAAAGEAVFWSPGKKETPRQTRRNGRNIGL